MPKLKLSLGADAAKVEAVEGFANYEGPVPPAGTYPASIISIKAGESKSKKPMFTVYVKIDAPKNDPKGRNKYNGYLISHFLIIPEDKSETHYGLQVGQINRLMDAISGDDRARKALWSGNAVLDEKGEKILSIAGIKLKSGIKVIVATKSETYKRKVKDEETGETKIEPTKTLRINDFFPAKKDDEVPEEEAAEFEEEGGDEEDGLDPDQEDEDSGAESDDDNDQDDEESGDQPDDDDGSDGDADDESEPDDEGVDQEDDADQPDDSDEDSADETDGADLIAEEVAEEEPADEKPARKRRSAF